jgi:hypothetical protein
MKNDHTLLTLGTGTTSVSSSLSLPLEFAAGPATLLTLDSILEVRAARYPRINMH